MRHLITFLCLMLVCGTALAIDNGGMVAAGTHGGAFVDKVIYGIFGLGAGLLVMWAVVSAKTLVSPSLDTGLSICSKAKKYIDYRSRLGRGEVLELLDEKKPEQITMPEAIIAAGIFGAAALRASAVVFMVTMFALYL